MLAYERANCSERLKITCTRLPEPSVYHKTGQEKVDTTFNKNQVEQKPIKWSGREQDE